MHRLEWFEGWYVVCDGRCVFTLTAYTDDLFSLTAVICAIVRFEEFDLVRIRFFEFCTRRVHNWKEPDETRFREIGLLVDLDEATPVNVAYWEWCEAGYSDSMEACAILLGRAAAGEKPSAPKEPKGREKQEIPAYDFREVAYPNSNPKGPGDECSYALYCMTDDRTCLFVRLVNRKLGSPRESIRIARAIIQQDTLDPMHVIFYDATPGTAGWTRVSAISPGPKPRFSTEAHVPPNPFFSGLITRVVDGWYRTAPDEPKTDEAT